MGLATVYLTRSLYFFNALWAVLSLFSIYYGRLGLGFISLEIVILAISVFGCYGAKRQSARMMWVYTTFLIVLLGLVIVLMCLSSRNVFKKFSMENVDEVWKKEVAHPGSMDAMQLKYSCCGHYSIEDYKTIEREVPQSCCKGNSCGNPANLNIIGCLTRVEETFNDEESNIKMFEWSVVIFDLTLLMLSFILALKFGHQNRRMNYA